MVQANEPHLLLVEDDRQLAEMVCQHLRSLSVAVTHCDNGDAGMRLALSGRFDLLLLDIMLPGTSGLDICYAVRQRDPLLPIIMVTALDSEADRVMGLTQGSDDYLVKPFSIRELKARVQSQLRRLQALKQVAAGPELHSLACDDLVLDLDARSCRLGSREIELTAREFDLLRYFMEHPGRAFSRGQLLDAVWGYNYEGFEHTVNSHINRLRTKLEADPGKPRFILTVWGLGYKFAQPDNAGAEA